MLVAPGTVIALTMPLLVYQGELPSYLKKEDCLCERRPSGPHGLRWGGWG